MATYRDDGTPVIPGGRPPLSYRDDGQVAAPVVVRRRGGGLLVGLLLLVAIIVALLFCHRVLERGRQPAWRLAQGLRQHAPPGALPKVDLESKSIVVGTKQETVAVPTLGVKSKQDGN